jgi:Pyridine nucleotide-disulphide oxidoreductase
MSRALISLVLLVVLACITYAAKGMRHVPETVTETFVETEDHDIPHNDVVVIGAGMAGLAAANKLATAGYKVCHGWTPRLFHASPSMQRNTGGPCLSAFWMMQSFNTHVPVHHPGGGS